MAEGKRYISTPTSCDPTYILWLQLLFWEPFRAFFWIFKSALHGLVAEAPFTYAKALKIRSHFHFYDSLSNSLICRKNKKVCKSLKKRSRNENFFIIYLNLIAETAMLSSEKKKKNIIKFRICEGKSNPARTVRNLINSRFCFVNI